MLKLVYCSSPGHIVLVIVKADIFLLATEINSQINILATGL